MAYVNTLFNTNFLEYASYVIKDRAIPHVDDGLKPVQRRILHSLFEMDDGKFHKVANLVGHCMKYHPHGDASIYEALVVLANKELLIEKQGNFGNIFTGDQASASRYIECRATPFAKEVLYNPEITNYDDSYDGRNREPVVFPAKIPLVLVLGAEGIAVGMSTKILPHNLIEVLQAMKAFLLGKSFRLFPDFPTGGLVDVSDYQDGLGKVLVRAKLDTSDPKRILIRDLPFGATTDSLITSIENAVRRNKLKIQSINDFTTENVEIEIKLARGVYSNEVVDALYAFTDCESAISCNLLVIRERNPAAMTVTEVIEYHAGRLTQILKAELELEKRQLTEKLHARTLERIFIEERLYKRIEQMETQNKVVSAVISGFVPFAAQIQREVTVEDVERLLKIPIRRISLYDINRAKQEMEEIRARLKQIAHHLKHLVDYAVAFLDRIIKEQSAQFERKTEVVSFQRVDAREAAQRNLTLRYDGETGYLGTEVSAGKPLFDVSEFDRILIMRKSGIYSITDVPERLFVDKGMLACGLADKEILSEKVFSVLYRQNSSGYPYLKRCKIEQFILDKNYSIVPDECTPLACTTKTDVAAEVRFAPAKRKKAATLLYPVADFPVKGLKAAGVRIVAKVAEFGHFVSLDKRTRSSVSRPNAASPARGDAQQAGGSARGTQGQRAPGGKTSAKATPVKKGTPGGKSARKNGSGSESGGGKKPAAGGTGKRAGAPARSTKKPKKPGKSR
ncbi:MAG TPA: DNA topoisomerase IV subunit A [Spirochaetia bacterium]|nr:DNA topoisomerase IV subunit A [Spirochaetia bacterium]